MSRKPSVPVSPVVFVNGQHWKFGTQCIRIGHVGKLLVEHRGISLEVKRAPGPKRWIAIKELQQFMADNQGVLYWPEVVTSPVPPDKATPPIGRRPRSAGGLA